MTKTAFVGKNRARFISQVEDCLQGCGLSMAGREGGMGKRMDGDTCFPSPLAPGGKSKYAPSWNFHSLCPVQLCRRVFFSGWYWQNATIQVFVFLAFPASCGWVLGCPGSLWLQAVDTRSCESRPVKQCNRSHLI